MRVTFTHVENFVSYKELSFSFKNQGLTLVSGPTGAGKSTLCDVIPWLLFGVTGKNGGVDEVRNWASSKPTAGYIDVELPSGETLRVSRSRGPNDLYFYTFNPDFYQGSEPNYRRGKDLNDTQKLINNLLGFNAETYLAGAYFHEFSSTASFFTATAKNRRQLLEQVADLSMAVTLNERLTDYAKDIKEEMTTAISELKAKKDRLSYIKQAIAKAEDSKADWQTRQDEKIARTTQLFNNFEADKIKKIDAATKTHSKQLTALQDEYDDLIKTIKPDTHYKGLKAYINTEIQALGNFTCEHCGAPKDNTKHLLVTRKLHTLEKDEATNTQLQIQADRLQRSITKHTNALPMELANIASSVNTYGDVLTTLKNETNPHTNIIAASTTDKTLVSEEIKDWQDIASSLELDKSDAELLKETVSNFRMILVKNVITELQNSTNKLLNDHFDAEIRVQFTADSSDKLDVTIFKDGNECVYTQLSKGQRQLLRLTFGISVMRIVSNHNGTHFSAVFLDEAFDGLSEELKTKAYGLLEELAQEHESVFCVEHSQELKSLFSHEYRVTLTDEGSQIEEL